VIWACDTSSHEPHKASELKEVTPQERLLINQSNQLLFRYLNVLQKDHSDENLFFSPVSIGMALGMANNCAIGETKNQILTSSGFTGFSEVEINKSFSELSRFLQNLDQDVSIGLSNTFWHRQNLNVDQSFKDLIMAYYDAEAEGINFSSNQSPKYINRIVDFKTKGAIPQAITSLNPDHKAFMYNAAGFSAVFEEKFEDVIPARPFFKGKEKIMTPYFYKEAGAFQYFEDDRQLALEVPLGESQFGFMVIMPKAPLSFKLDFYQFSEISARMDTNILNVSLPVFKVNSEINLNSVFAQIGFPKALDGTAQFKTGPDESIINIDLFTHRAAIDLSQSMEKLVNAKNKVSHELPAHMVNINQPFLYFIKEKHTGLILFAGKVVTPGA
ncbi:MAG: serpin family protein, partial [Bacteroidota bacterium]